MGATAGATYSRLVADALTRFGDRAAFVQDDGTVLTYAAAADLVARMRAVLAGRGVGLGSGVGLLSPNGAEMWLGQAAAWVAGARATNLHPLGSEDDHVFCCDDAGIEVLLADPSKAVEAAAVAERSATIKHVYTFGPAEAGEDLLAACERHGTARLDPGCAGEDDLVYLWYTGGTTGRAKAVMHPHRSMVQSVSTLSMSCEVPVTPRTLVAAPMTHSGGLTVLPTLMRGGTVVIHRAFDPVRFVRALDEHRITWTLAVPTMVYAVLDHGGPENHDLSALETVTYGASPMVPSRLAEAQERIGNVFSQVYGQSECIAGTALLKAEHDPEGRPDLLASCGRPMIGIELALLDDAGAEVATGDVGEICMRSRAVMDGYWQQPELTAQALAGGWLHTGDLARKDEDGYVFIVDRKKDMVISGGFNIYPKEVEDVLAAHPGVSRAAVIGVPHEHWGEEVKAFVVARPGMSVDPAELIALVRDKKGPAHAPKTVEVVDDLPLTPVGKVDKKVLRAPYWGAEGRAVH